MDKKPVYRGKEYYYQDSHMHQKINQLRSQESGRENYEFTRNEPANQGKIVLEKYEFTRSEPKNADKIILEKTDPRFYGI